MDTPDGRTERGTGRNRPDAVGAAARAFGERLDRHLRTDGTRPDGCGTRWTYAQFAATVGADTRLVLFWRSGERIPNDLAGIEAALFGDHAPHDAARRELRELHRLAQAERAGIPPATPGRPSAPPTPDLPTPGPCLGRDSEIADLLALLVPTEHGAVTALILGGPGYGKTLLTETVAAHPAIAGRFGPRRWFVKLETAPGARDTIVAIAAALGLDPQTRLDFVAAFLAAAPALLVLDNAETPWEADRAGTEALLHRLAAVPNLALMASLRGEDMPAAPFSRTVWLEPLPGPVARELFLSIAQRIDPSHPDLPFFVADRTGVLGGIPLAVTLVARRAALEGNLALLSQRWDSAGVALAARLGRPAGRLDSLAASIGFSLDSPRLGAEGRRLFALLGLAPAGLAEPDGAALLGEHWIEATGQLHAVGLLAPGERCDLLPPVRDHARRAAPASEADAAAWRRHLLDLVRAEGGRFGRQGGAEAVRRLLPEIPNIAAALDGAIAAADVADAVPLAYGLGQLFRFTGFGAVALLDRLTDACAAAGDRRGEAEATACAGDVALARSDHAAARARFEAALPLYRAAGDVQGEANCIKSLGDIALARSDHAAARARYEAALPLYCAIGDVLGEANCIKGLGDIALVRSDHTEARARYEAALPLYRATGDVLGEANCIACLGDIALQRSDHAEARARFEAALPLYRAVGSVLGEANCIKGLGEIALRRSDHTEARARFEAALPLYRAVGSVQGEANCIKGLGEIALRRSDHTEARARFEAALPLYRAVSDVLGEANCIRRLGDIARAEGDTDAAHAAFTLALALYERIPQPYSIGATHERLADISAGPARAAHLAAARAAWTSIDRPDLVAKLPEA